MSKQELNAKINLIISLTNPKEKDIERLTLDDAPIIFEALEQAHENPKFVGNVFTLIQNLELIVRIIDMGMKPEYFAFLIFWFALEDKKSWAILKRLGEKYSEKVLEELKRKDENRYFQFKTAQEKTAVVREGIWIDNFHAENQDFSADDLANNLLDLIESKKDATTLIDVLQAAMINKTAILTPALAILNRAFPALFQDTPLASEEGFFKLLKWCWIVESCHALEGAKPLHRTTNQAIVKVLMAMPNQEWQGKIVGQLPAQVRNLFLRYIHAHPKLKSKFGNL